MQILEPKMPQNALTTRSKILARDVEEVMQQMGAIVSLRPSRRRWCTFHQEHIVYPSLW